MKRLSILASALFLLSALSASAQIAAKIEREKIAGLDVLVLKTGVKDVVTIRGSLPAGDAAAPEANPALATLAGGMLDQGTVAQDKYAIAQKLESVGATLDFSVDNNVLAISGKCLRKDVPLVIGLIAEQLRTPRWDPEEFAKLKKQIAGSLQRSLESTDYRAAQAFNNAVYPAGHPNRNAPTEEFLAASEKATLEEVKAFHAAYYGPAELKLVLVGDIDPAGAKAEVARAFAGWTGGKPAVRAAAKARPLDNAREQTVFMADKTSVSVVWGTATGMKYTDPDALAFRVGTAILGQGFTGRLMANVRDKEGLTYGIGARVDNDTFNDGEWRITATFAPALLEQGITSTRRQLTSWFESGVTADELERRKSNLAGTYKVALSTTGGMASQILATLHRGYDLSFLDEYPQKVEALKLEQVNGAIKKHLAPDNLVLIKAGTVLDAPPAK
ncbi:MAG TPA: pitrilysin family protein [Opitutaceae bacterium]